jgi:UDP-N-acetylmuramate dehydrogenase
MPFPLPDALASIPHRRDVPFARLTTLGVGGICRWLFEPVSVAQAQAFVRACAREGLAWRMLGGGSNLVVLGDVDLALRLRFPEEPRRAGLELEAPASFGHIKLSLAAADLGLAGLEYASGIPGSVGGAMHMNAGAYGRELVDVLARYQFLTAEGELVEKAPEPGEFRYRWSVLGGGRVALGLTTGAGAAPASPCTSATPAASSRTRRGRAPAGSSTRPGSRGCGWGTRK